MIDHSRMALVGAIGGTYISLAVMDIDELTVSDFALLNSADFASPMEAITRYLKSIPKTPNKVGLSVAGKVKADEVTMSHLPWTFTRNDIRAVTGADHICFVSEFDALALSLPHLSRYELIDIADGERVLHGTKLAIGAGTGFGAAAIVWVADAWHAVSGESRYVTLPADGPAGALTADDAFSGRGLVALYAELEKKNGGKPQLRTAPEITRAALAAEDEAAVEALNTTVVRLGRFVGDLALVYGASGGVYLGGGLPANIVPALATPCFREAFEGEGGRRDYLGNVPVYAIKTAADAGLRGAAVALAQSLPVRPAARRPISHAS
jgi:glucokinase